jgi:large repetitive protein
VDGDRFSGSLARAAGEDVDSYAISQGTLSLGDNYTINFTGSTLTITPRAISAAADSQSKIYGEDDPELTYEITAGSLVDGDSFSGGLARTVGEDVGSYAIGQGTLSLGDNYTINFTGNELAVTPRALVIKAIDATKVYGESDSVFEVQYTNLAPSDTAGVISGLTLLRQPGSAAGRYTITPGNAENGNYSISYVSGTLTIVPKQIMIIAEAKSREYGQADPKLTYTTAAGALEAGDALSGQIIREPGENVGGYAIMQGT